MSRRAQLTALAVVFLAVAGFAVARYPSDAGPDSPRYETSGATDPEWDYEIPAGTGDRIAAGEDIEILPREIEAQVGESIRIANDDDEPYLLGPWYVDAGETMTQRFASEGVFEGDCAVHPSGQLRLVVSA